MPLEIEIKVKVDGHDAVRSRLVALGAASHGRVRETNIFFDRPDGSLRRQETGLRVRFSVAASETRTLLTVKGPPGTSGLRPREAYDVSVAPADQLVPLLMMLGFRQILLFEKDRESWALDGCLIELDTMPVFGTFVEVEGPGERAVREVQAKLGLGDLPPQRAGYSKMVGEYVERQGITARELRLAPL